MRYPLHLSSPFCSLPITYSETANASLSLVALGRVRHTLACMKAPGPRVGSREGGSVVAKIISGTHFFPHNTHGLRIRIINERKELV